MKIRPTSIIVLVRDPLSPHDPLDHDGSIENGFTTICPGGHRIVVDEPYAHEVFQSCCERWLSLGELDLLTIIGPRHGQFDPSALIWSAADSQLTKKAWVSLDRCVVTAKLFGEMVSRWHLVELVNSRLNLLEIPKAAEAAEAAKCRELRFCNLDAANVKPVRVGDLAWPSLRDLFVVQCANSAALVEAFYAPSLTDLSLDASGDVEFLLNLPPSRKLKRLQVKGATPECLAWASTLPSLQRLDFYEYTSDAMPWERLRSSSRLRTLEVTSSTFSDDDLTQIGYLPSLERLEVYYTPLTTRSWPRLLSFPKLKQLWVGASLLEGQIPYGLPESTTLGEIVTLNTGKEHHAWLTNLLSRYPNVETSDT